MPSQLKYIVEAYLAILLALVTVKALEFFSSSEFIRADHVSTKPDNTSYIVTNSKGRTLFYEKCANCHSVTKKIAGPPLAGIEERVPDKQLLIAWIKNNQKVLRSGNVYFNNLLKEYNNIPMDVFSQLDDAEINLILEYIKEEENTNRVIG